MGSYGRKPAILILMLVTRAKLLDQKFKKKHEQTRALLLLTDFF